MRTRKPFTPPADPDEDPEVRQALAKAEQNAAHARSSRTREDRDYYERMSRKWLGIAKGWRVIADVGKAH